MIADLMRYGLTVALLIAVAGLALERVAAWRGASRRGIWLCALLLSLALPTLGVMVSSRVAAPVEATVVTPAPIAGRATHGPAPDYGLPDDQTAAATATPSVKPERTWPTVATLETHLWSFWIATSLGILTLYALLWLRLRLTARHWRRETMGSQVVWITESLGPAVFGFLRPRILMPQWTLEAPSAARSAMLTHEQEHVAAGDPWLLLLGLLLVAAAPWNLPLW